MEVILDRYGNVNTQFRPRYFGDNTNYNTTFYNPFQPVNYGLYDQDQSRREYKSLRTDAVSFAYMQSRAQAPMPPSAINQMVTTPLAYQAVITSNMGERQGSYRRLTSL